MHPCFRLAKKPALRKMAATSSLGDKYILYPYSFLKPVQNIHEKKYFLSLLNPQTHPGYSSKDILDPYSTIKPIQNIFQNLNGFHKVRPGRSLPLFLLSLLHLWSGKSFIGKHPKKWLSGKSSCAKESWCMRLYGKDEKVIFLFTGGRRLSALL